jgi:predicted nucleic acid-binding protein
VFAVLHRVHPLTEAVARRAARFVGLGLTGYDAMYAALAEELEACWLTFDAGAHSRIAAERVSFDLNTGLPQDWGIAAAG